MEGTLLNTIMIKCHPFKPIFKYRQAKANVDSLSTMRVYVSLRHTVSKIFHHGLIKICDL